MAELEPLSQDARRTTQFLTAGCATFGALAMGAMIGYSSPASAQLKGDNTTDCPLIGGEPLDDMELSWFSSAINLGALAGAPITGILINKTGRRSTMIMSIVPFLLGWILLALARNTAMLVSGRVFCGLCAGLASLSVPTYIAEIASPDIRGTLGTCFQLMVTLGIVYSYAVGTFLCWQYLAIACLVPAVLFSVTMIFAKESPTFLLMKGRTEDARNALQHFRGELFNIEPEMVALEGAIREARDSKGSAKDLLLSHNLKPLIISLLLMFFQQFSGINCILFNLEIIFKSSGSSLSSAMSTIIVAALQVVMTVIATVLMDKAGRKLLLLVSSAAMTVTLAALGVYFYLKENDNPSVPSLGWLPLISIAVFIAAFSIGYGPIPWLMMGEIFSPDVRDLACTVSTMTNWALAFVTTLIFRPLQAAMKDSGVFWLFSGCCILNFIFCLLVVKETKGKTSQEIAAMFGANKRH